MDLAKSGRADRMALRFEAAGRIDWHAPTDRQFAALCSGPSVAHFGKAEKFDSHDFAHRGRIMDLDHRDIGWANAGPLVGGVRRTAADCLVQIVRSAG